MVAYGVVRQSLLYPDENRIGTNIIGVFNKPYWNLYGELFLEETNYNPSQLYKVYYILFILFVYYHNNKETLQF